MNPGLAVKLYPTGPWRCGSGSGTRDRVDPVYHSDSLYSAVTGAMISLGLLEQWLSATARNRQGSAVRFSSCFPFLGDRGFIIAPRNIWPPAPSPKVRWKGARFIPLPLVQALMEGQMLDENRWMVDGPSGCLIPAGSRPPFRPNVRWNVAVDRLHGGVELHSTACLEFTEGAGLWAVISFADEEQRQRWSQPVQAALRLLADSGFGGERSRGWGRAAPPEFVEGDLPDMILKQDGRGPERPEGEPALPELAYWLLSLFAPASEDRVDWQRGSYSLVPRGGRVESPVRAGDPKKLVNMVEEGSVLFAAEPVRGGAVDVAPDAFPHPVFRAGFAVAVPIRWQTAA